MSDKYEALAKVIQGPKGPNGRPLSGLTDWGADRVVERLVEFLTSDEAIERVAKVMAEVTGEPRVGRFERTMSRAVLLAALGVTE